MTGINFPKDAGETGLEVYLHEEDLSLSLSLRQQPLVFYLRCTRATHPRK